MSWVIADAHQKSSALIDRIDCKPMGDSRLTFALFTAVAMTKAKEQRVSR
jgi:hypothetical protein